MGMGGEPVGDMCENSNMGAFRGPDKVISVSRRRELMDLAGKAADWIMEHNVKPYELCVFKRMVEMLVDVR